MYILMVYWGGFHIKIELRGEKCPYILTLGFLRFLLPS